MCSRARTKIPSNARVPEKILVVQADKTNTIKMVHLRGDWYDTPASVKSFVHIIGNFESTGQCVIDNAQNMLILHPDQLISSTVVADSFWMYTAGRAAGQGQGDQRQLPGP